MVMYVKKSGLVQSTTISWPARPYFAGYLAIARRNPEIRILYIYLLRSLLNYSHGQPLRCPCIIAPSLPGTRRYISGECLLCASLDAYECSTVRARLPAHACMPIDGPGPCAFDHDACLQFRYRSASSLLNMPSPGVRARLHSRTDGTIYIYTLNLYLFVRPTSSKLNSI